MTLKHLRIFVEVCRMDSITKAAENLNMAQPAVSNAIRELESFYQVKLFERMNRKIYITSAGKYLCESADAILSQFDESKDVLLDIASSTKIRIGSNVSFGTNYLSEIVSDFQKIHPEIPVTTIIENSSQIEDHLLHNEIDFAIVDNLNASSNIHQILLKEEPMTALYSPDFSYLPSIVSTSGQKKRKTNHSSSPEKLAISICDFEKIPLLVRETGSGCRDILDKAFHDYGIHPDIALESISTQALIEFCERGQGILFLPDHQAQKYISSGMFLELHIKEIDLKRHYYFIYHQKKYLTKSMHYFLDYILNLRT